MIRRRRSLRGGILLAAAVMAVGVCTVHGVVGRHAVGQLVAKDPFGPASGKELANNVFPTANREVVRYLTAARKLFAQGDHDQAVWMLQREIINPTNRSDEERKDQDFFVQPDPERPQVHRSLRYEARQLIGQMSDAYQARYGAEANVMLGQAVASGEPTRLGDVSRLFFHTEAGYTATLLLGLHHLDHGRPLAGALTLQRLGRAEQFEPTLSLAAATCWLQAGMADKATEQLATLKETLSGETITVAGKEVPWFEQTDEATDWLADLVGPRSSPTHATDDQWTMFCGVASRNAVSSGGAPLLNVRWRIPATDDPATEDMLNQIRQGYEERGVPAMVGLHPLVVDDVVLMRTVRNLLAVDLISGKRLWEVPVDDPVQASLPSRSGTVTINGFSTVRQPSSQLAAGLARRIRDDATFGTLSSDGRYVFSIEDLKMNASTSTSNPGIFIGGINRTSTSSRPHNRLAAFDIRTGKLKWNLGGPADQYRLRLAETYFLGPPLPLRGELYVLAEMKGEIALLVLDAATGDLRWSQPLAMAGQDGIAGPMLRSGGMSPSYADGVLVCPTSAGAVVGVELATRSLLWGYRYTMPAATSSRQQAIIRMQMARSGRIQTSSRWADGMVSIVDGHVLITPAESDSLYCLKLIDGTPAWEKPLPRGDSLYLACVHQGIVVLVGKNEVRAVRLADGKPAWDGREIALPEGAVPSGRGFATQSKYYLPLSSAAVASIDLKQGKIDQISRSRKGTVPGNLICCKNRMISQGYYGLEAFSLLDSVREDVSQRLATAPDDPAALAQRGEILLDQGQQTEAISCFRRAYDLQDDPRTRGLLRDALLEGLGSDFATYRARADEVEQLLDTTAHRATFLRLKAAGLNVAGEHEAAFNQYLELADLDSDPRQMDQVTGMLSVRRDRWLREQLAALYEASDEATRNVMIAEVATRLDAARDADDLDALRNHLACFDRTPAASGARAPLIDSLRKSEQLLQAEWLLWPDCESADPKVAGPAVAQLAEMLYESKRIKEAAACYAKLDTDFADVICRDGKTGRQLLEAIAEKDPLREELPRKVSWPVGLVEPKKETRSRSVSSAYGRHTMRVLGETSPFLAKTTIRFDQSRNMILGRDDLGNQVWEVSTIKPGAVRKGVSYMSNLAHARARGHLLLVSTGVNVFAVDLLGKAVEPGATPKPTLLWSQNLNDAAGATAVGQMVIQGNVIFIGGMGGVVSYGSKSVGGTGMGPVTDRYVCFQTSSRLVAADPMTGKPFWTRRAVPRGSELFGDEEFIFALPNDKAEALVFRAIDGELLGKRKIERPKSVRMLPDGTRNEIYTQLAQACLATSGRNLLRWRTADGKRLLELYDPWFEKAVWESTDIPSDAKACMVGHDRIGVLDGKGRFTLRSVETGKTIFETTLQPETNLTEIFLFPWDDGHILVTHAPKANAAFRPMPISPMPGMLYRPITSGRVYALDSQGKPLWPKPTPITRQYLLLDQPPGLPALVFACQMYQQKPDPRGRYKISILCIDKRTGRWAYKQEDYSNSTSVFELTGDPKTHSINMGMRQTTLQLTFTDKPMPPPTETGEEEPKAKNTTEALMRAFKKAVSDPIENSIKSNPLQDAIPKIELPGMRPAPPVRIPGAVLRGFPALPGIMPRR